MYLFVLVFFLFFSSCGEQVPQAISLHALISDNEIEDWKKQGASDLYRGEDLFHYINGGAEIYHEYGFEQVLVQDYANLNGKSISLEIFEMTTPESAFGI